MKNVFKTSCLFAAASVATAFLPRLSADPINRADPYMTNTNQYPALQQNYGIQAEYNSDESMGMRRARLAGQSTVVTTSSPLVAANVNRDLAPNSEVMIAIRTAITTVANLRGPAAAVDATDITSSINNAPFESHGMLAVYQLRVDAGSASIDSLQSRSAQFAGDGPTRFTEASRDCQTARTQLNDDFAAANNATPDSWNQVRSQLAKDYQNYADAVARAQRAANRNS